MLFSVAYKKTNKKIDACFLYHFEVNPTKLDPLIGKIELVIEKVETKITADFVDIF